MNEFNRGGSERGSIESRRGRQGLAGMFDWDPFRSLFPSNLQQMFGLDVHRKEDGYEIEMPVPGYRPEDLDISYQDGVLTISGHNERRNFTRSLTVPEDIDEDNIQAQVEHGMLILTLRQHPKRAPKRITVGSTTTGSIDTSQQQQKQTTR